MSGLKIVLSVAGLFILLAVGGLALYAWRQLGASPTRQELTSYASLPYFKNGQFVASMDTSVYMDRVPGGKKAMLKQLFCKEPVPVLPVQKLSGKDFTSPAQGLAVYWLGHSSLLIELGGKRILIDPVLGNAAPVPGLFGRYAPSPLTRKDLPPVDYVLITHNHYDHLEAATMRALKNTSSRFIVPLGVGAALKSWGINESQITQLAWDQSVQEGGLQIIAFETGHYSNRRPGDKNKTLWVGYVLQANGRKIYVSGDSGYSAELNRRIAQKYGPFDLAFIEIDAWNEGWPGMHLFPQQAVQTARDIGAKEMIAVHWGVFNLGQHPWNESIEKVSRLAQEQNVRLAVPRMGQRYEPGKTKTDDWWKNL